MKKLVILGIAILFIAMVLIGFLVPIDTYTIKHGCPTGNDDTVKLHLLRGDSLERIKKFDRPPSGPLDECGPIVKYQLYIF